MQQAITATETIPRHSDAPAARRPLEEIENDMRALIERCASLTGELESAKTASETNMRKLLLGCIEVADAFENVLRNITPKLDTADGQSRIWVGNFRTVFRMLQRALTAWGVTPIETLIGTTANPHWHNVAEVIQAPDREDETIVEEIRKGYLWQGRLLRAADVRAVKNK